MRSKNPDIMKKIKAFAEGYYRMHHISPSIRAIADGTGIARATVQRYLVEMDERGMLVYRGHAGAPSPVRRTTHAGAPSPAHGTSLNKASSPTQVTSTQPDLLQSASLQQPDSPKARRFPAGRAPAAQGASAQFTGTPSSPAASRANASMIITGAIEKCTTGYFSAPIVGSIRCGDPENEEEQVEEYVSLPESIFGKGGCYLLHAAGDSMEDAGIEEGDLLVIRMQQTAKVGDIVVALDQDRQNTLKRYGGRGKNGKFRLEYMNERRYPGEVIEVPEFTVQGVVKHIIKSL